MKKTVLEKADVSIGSKAQREGDENLYSALELLDLYNPNNEAHHKSAQYLYLNELVRIIRIINSNKTNEDEKKRQEKRADDIATELVANGLTVEDIPSLLNPIQNELIKKGNEDKDWWPDKQREDSSCLRELEARLYEKIFENEYQDREETWDKAKSALGKWFLIIPLFFAAGYAIAYAVKKYKTSTLVAYDMNWELFSEIPPKNSGARDGKRDWGSWFGRIDDKQIEKFPVKKKEDEPLHCSKAIVFRSDVKYIPPENISEKIDLDTEDLSEAFKEGKKISTFKYADLLPQAFFGTSHLKENAELQKDIRIYTTRYNHQDRRLEHTLKHNIELDENLDQEATTWIKV